MEREETIWGVRQYEPHPWGTNTALLHNGYFLFIPSIDMTNYWREGHNKRGATAAEEHLAELFLIAAILWVFFIHSLLNEFTPCKKREQ